MRWASSSQFFSPRIRFCPCSAAVRLSSSGLVCRKFAGDAASSNSLPAKLSRAAWASGPADAGAERLLPPGGPVAVSACIDVEGPHVPGGIVESELRVAGRQRCAAGGVGRELPAVEELLVGTLRQLRLLLRMRGDAEVPAPPGLEIVIGGEPAGERGELRAQLPLRLGLRRTRRRRSFPRRRRSFCTRRRRFCARRRSFCAPRRRFCARRGRFHAGRRRFRRGTRSFRRRTRSRSGSGAAVRAGCSFSSQGGPHKKAHPGTFRSPGAGYRQDIRPPCGRALPWRPARCQTG